MLSGKVTKLLLLLIGGVIGLNLIAAILYDALLALRPGVLDDALEAGHAYFDESFPDDPDAAFRFLSQSREIFYGSESDSLVGWRHDSSVDVDMATLDKDGFRVTPGNPTAPVGTIHMFGASTLFGYMVRDQEHIAAYVQELFPTYKVKNYAQIGYTSTQELQLFIQELISLDGSLSSDIVVFYDGINDHSVGCSYPGTQSEYVMFHLQLRDLTRIGKAHYRDSRILGTFAAVAYDNVLRLWRGEPYDPMFIANRCAHDPAHRRRVGQTLVRNWEIAKALTEERGGRFYAFLHPIWNVGNPDVSYFPGEMIDFFRATDVYSESYREMPTLIEESAPWAGDLTGIYDGQRLMYIDYTHPTPSGARVAARQILQRITPTVGGAATRPRYATGTRTLLIQ